MLVATTALVVWIQYRDISRGALHLSPEIRTLLGAGDDNGGHVRATWRPSFLLLPSSSRGLFWLEFVNCFSQSPIVRL
jgi:hypothetical protein